MNYDRFSRFRSTICPQSFATATEVSRETIEAGTRVLQELAKRNLSELNVLVAYVDGIQFGDYHVLAAVGVDATGREARAEASRRPLGERDGGDWRAGGNGRARAADGSPAAVRDRRGQALRRSIGHVFGKASLVDVAGGVKAGSRRGHPEAVCSVAGAGVAVGGSQPA